MILVMLCLLSLGKVGWYYVKKQKFKTFPQNHSPAKEIPISLPPPGVWERQEEKDGEVNEKEGEQIEEKNFQEKREILRDGLYWYKTKFFIKKSFLQGENLNKLDKKGYYFINESINYNNRVQACSLGKFKFIGFDGEKYIWMSQKTRNFSKMEEFSQNKKIVLKAEVVKGKEQDFMPCNKWSLIEVVFEKFDFEAHKNQNNLTSIYIRENKCTWIFDKDIFLISTSKNDFFDISWNNARQKMMLCGKKEGHGFFTTDSLYFPKRYYSVNISHSYRHHKNAGLGKMVDAIPDKVTFDKMIHQDRQVSGWR
jgi:hypothetical protein